MSLNRRMRMASFRKVASGVYGKGNGEQMIGWLR